MKQFYVIILLFLYTQYIISYEVGDIIQLPEPQKDGGMTLNEALNNRKSSRDFDNTKKVINPAIKQKVAVRVPEANICQITIKAVIR